MPEAPDAHALASAARDLMRVESDRTMGLWPRAVALLARQALELAMARLWTVAAPGLGQTSFRCQLLCVGPMLNDQRLGGRVAATWNVLSMGCHHRAYDLPLTAAELSGALDTVWQLADAAERLRGRVKA